MTIPKIEQIKYRTKVTKRSMEPSKKNTLPIEGKKGEIILYQPDENFSVKWLSRNP